MNSIKKWGVLMIEKRFTETVSTGIVADNKTGIEYSCEMRIDNDFLNLVNTLVDENEQLKSENKRLTDKLNKTALELVSECISQGKATEISEMSYSEFLDYRARNGKPMELQK